MGVNPFNETDPLKRGVMIGKGTAKLDRGDGGERTNHLLKVMGRVENSTPFFVGLAIGSSRRNF